MGWANHRANRLVDLAALTFRFSEASTIVQGVEWSALHSFGCTAPKVAKQIQKKSRGLVFLGTILKSKQGINASK
mgnify:CR=1 FL=1